MAEFSLTSCVWARFLIGSHAMPGWRHGHPTPTSLGMGVCVFRCNLPPALLAKWSGSFTCHWGNTEVERALNKSQHTKLTLEKKILPPLLPEFELATFRLRVRRSYQQVIPAHYYYYYCIRVAQSFFFFFDQGQFTLVFALSVTYPIFHRVRYVTSPLCTMPFCVTIPISHSRELLCTGLGLGLGIGLQRDPFCDI